jgi:hypothetical protein
MANSDIHASHNQPKRGYDIMEPNPDEKTKEQREEAEHLSLIERMKPRSQPVYGDWESQQIAENLRRFNNQE